MLISNSYSNIYVKRTHRSLLNIYNVYGNIYARNLTYVLLNQMILRTHLGRATLYGTLFSPKGQQIKEVTY